MSRGVSTCFCLSRICCDCVVKAVGPEVIVEHGGIERILMLPTDMQDAHDFILRSIVEVNEASERLQLLYSSEQTRLKSILVNAEQLARYLSLEKNNTVVNGWYPLPGFIRAGLAKTR